MDVETGRRYSEFPWSPMGAVGLSRTEVVGGEVEARRASAAVAALLRRRPPFLPQLAVLVEGEASMTQLESPTYLIREASWGEAALDGVVAVLQLRPVLFVLAACEGWEKRGKSRLLRPPNETETRTRARLPQ